MTITSLGLAAREDGLAAALEVLLDEIEAHGGVVTSEQRQRLGARLSHIAKVRAIDWAKHGELAAADFYARTLTLTELDVVRPSWQAMLDASGPWLRALRPIETPTGLVAELHDDVSWAWLSGPLVQFMDDDRVVLEWPRDEGPQRCLWSWTQARVEPRSDLPAIIRRDQDPRFESGRNAPVVRRGLFQQELDWPEFGQAHAIMSANERQIFLYGTSDDEGRAGLLRILDAVSLQVVRELEFDDDVATVIEGVGRDELLIATYAETLILRGDERRWQFTGPFRGVAWSPSGRFVARFVDEVAQIWDTHASTHESDAAAGLPVAFSPDGARLVDGCGLFDGHTGARLATLDVRLGHYLCGGPLEPWFHVGTELIACHHGEFQLWDARDGAAIETPPPPYIGERLAFSHSGRNLVHDDAYGSRRITLAELPSKTVLAQFQPEHGVFLFALSSTAEQIALLGRDGLVVVDRAGIRLHHGELGIDIVHEGRRRHRGQLRFDADDRRIVYSGCLGATDYVWELDGPELGKATSTPRTELIGGWTIEAGPISRFVGRDGVRMLIAHNGPWAANPAMPTLFACCGGLFELRGAAADAPRPKAGAAVMVYV